MHGTIRVESEIAKGSTFIFELTRKRPARQNETIGFDGIRPSESRVLIVDADKQSREYFKSITDRFGISTDEAENGKSAAILV